MLWDLLDDKEKANVLIKILFHLAKADGEIKEQEFSYLLYVANKLRIDPEELRSLNIPENELNEILPSDEQDRMNVLYHLLFLMEADTIVDEREEKVVFHFGHLLGFSELMIKDFIHVFKKNDLDDLPPSAMLDIVRKYQN
jgi:uncharacterized tellurite resistance protein B-like protein